MDMSGNFQVPDLNLTYTKQQIFGSRNQPKWYFKLQAPARDRTLIIRHTHTLILLTE